MEKLEAARDALSHSHPGADVEAILEAGLDLVIERAAARKGLVRLENGEVCGSTHRLQFDHIRPVALGGESTAANLRLACAAHNLLAARRVFGDRLMDRYAPGRSPGAMART